MPRSLGTVLYNNFSKGLITEATGLNFPDNAVTESDNVVFERVGRVTRRLGYDVEAEAEAFYRGTGTTKGIIKEYLWESVAKNGGFTFLVLQLGSAVVFYEMGTDEALSQGMYQAGISLDLYKVTGAADTNEHPCVFAAGAGYLFITHPSCEPLLVQYDDETQEFTVSKIVIHARDFEGLEDSLGVDEQPTDLSTEHAYNLKNQGWFKRVRVGSVTNEAMGGVPPKASDPMAFIFASLTDVEDL